MTKLIVIEQIKSTKTTGVAVKRLRKNLGLTQVELAKKVGVRQATISEMEQGKGGTLETFLKIIQAMKINFALTNQSSFKEKSKTQLMFEMMEE